MSKLDDAYNKAMKAAGASKLPKEVHGLPADGEYVGTCQACFGQYVVKQFKSDFSRAGSGGGFENMLKPMPKGKLVLVLHGYERPGYGYTEGECPGRGHEPFEVAKDVTELFRSRLASRIENARKTLAEMKRGEVKVLSIEVPDTESPKYGRTYPHPMKRIRIEPGWVNPVRDPYAPSHIDDFQSRLKEAIKNLERQISGMEGDLRYLDSRLAKWKYDPQSLINKSPSRKIGMRAEDQAAQESAAKARSSERNAARDLKEKKARATIDAYLSHPRALQLIKTKKTQVADPKGGFKDTDESLHDYVMSHYIRRADEEKNQVRRIEILKYAYSMFADAIRSHNWNVEWNKGPKSDLIKVKLPRG